MKSRTANLGVVALLFIILNGAALAQGQGASVAGKVTDDAGKPVANATVVIKNVASGQSSQSQTSAAGAYNVSGLAPGEYEVSVSASGFSAKTEKVTLTAGAAQTLNVGLTSSALSLESLGFPKSQTQGNPQEQARLDKRSHMLKIHQRLGLITTVPLVATLLTGNLAGGKATSSTGRNVHVALGSTAAGLYFTTAYFSLFAPKVPGTPTRGPIRLHKALAFIHGPGMILTPILGAVAYQQKSRGEHVHGIASAHVPVAVITSGAYGAAILSVSIKWHRKSGQGD
jgi:hypothetical protein